MNLQDAMSVLELTGVAGLTCDDLPLLAKRARKRWHPDTIAWRNDAKETRRYTRNFQAIEAACSAVLDYVKGRHETGARTQRAPADVPRVAVDVIRENAPEMRRKIGQLWPEMRRKKYRWSTERVIMAPGRKLREMLAADFADDISSLSVISVCYGPWPFLLGTAMLYALHPVLGWIGAVVAVGQVLSCVAGALPLARYWMNERVVEVMLWFINFGLGIFHWAQRKAQSDPWWAQLLVLLPVLVALAVRNIVLRPLYFLAKQVVGEKLIGVVEADMEYYAGFADWYVERLLAKPLGEMSEEELSHLSSLYGVTREYTGE